MSKPNGVLLWVLIGLGAIFLYAAYKGKSPQQIITDAASKVKG